METIDRYTQPKKSLFDRARAWFGNEQPAETRAETKQPDRQPPPVAPPVRLASSRGITNVVGRGRVSSDSPESFNGSLQGLTVFSNDSYWRKFALAETVNIAELQKIPLDKLAELLADISPEVSMALHIRTILSNTGYEIEAYKLGSDDKDEAAQKELDEMRARVAANYGTEDVFYNQLFLTLWLRGSIITEGIFDAGGRSLIDIATPDPKTLAFRKALDDLRGTVNDFGQWQNGNFVSFRGIEQIRYVPLNPFPNRLEGRPIISATFFIAVFLMAVLRDLKRVIQQQGYPRYDIEIDLANLKDLMPQDAEHDDTKFESWATAVKQSVINAVEGLEPDETFVHYSGVTINQPVGAMSTNSLSAIDGMFKALERMAARACRVPPLFMGITDGVSEANANRQFEAFLKDLENGQHIVENVMGSQYSLGLQAAGKPARVVFRFATMRASERMKDAQADLMEAQLAQLSYEMGWISQDEAAKRGAKVKAADQAKPRGAALPTVNPATAGNVNNVDSGANRGEKFRMPTMGEMADAKELFQSFVSEASADLIIADSKN